MSASVVVSIAAACISLTALWFTTSWRREKYRAAVIGFRLLATRKHFFDKDETGKWNAEGIHTSVRELRDELTNALPDLPDSALAIGVKMVEECKPYLIALRQFFDQGEVRKNELLMQLHSRWVDDMSGHIDALTNTLPKRTRNSFTPLAH
jgi:hypothetical protein